MGLPYLPRRSPTEHHFKLAASEELKDLGNYRRLVQFCDLRGSPPYCTRQANQWTCPSQLKSWSGYSSEIPCPDPTFSASQ